MNFVWFGSYKNGTLHHVFCGITLFIEGIKRHWKSLITQANQEITPSWVFLSLDCGLSIYGSLLLLGDSPL